jgi:hypothetical protein
VCVCVCAGGGGGGGGGGGILMGVVRKACCRDGDNVSRRGHLYKLKNSSSDPYRIKTLHTLTFQQSPPNENNGANHNRLRDQTETGSQSRMGGGDVYSCV